MSGYTEQTVWHFWVCGDAYTIQRFSHAARVLERYPNAPECGQLNLVMWFEDGRLQLEDGCREHGERHGHDVGAIVAHIERHGLPWEEKR